MLPSKRPVRERIYQFPDESIGQNWRQEKVAKEALLPRPPGMNEEIIVGGRGQYRSRGWTFEEPNAPLPLAPTFSEPLEEVSRRVAVDIGKVTCPKTVRDWHPVIWRILQKDDERKKKRGEARYSFAWDEPLFETAIERRRLRILNSLFLAVAMCLSRDR